MPAGLGPPVTDPRQVFTIGLNYRDHSAETNTPVPDAPLVFSKWPSRLAGPAAEVPLPTETVDWELELVVVIGEGGRDIPADRAFDHIAGFCVGQDISGRTEQLAGTPPQFGLGKATGTSARSAPGSPPSTSSMTRPTSRCPPRTAETPSRRRAPATNTCTAP